MCAPFVVLAPVAKRLHPCPHHSSINWCLQISNNRLSGPFPALFAITNNSFLTLMEMDFSNNRMTGPVRKPYIQRLHHCCKQHPLAALPVQAAPLLTAACPFRSPPLHCMLMVLPAAPHLRQRHGHDVPRLPAQQSLHRQGSVASSMRCKCVTRVALCLGVLLEWLPVPSQPIGWCSSTAGALPPLWGLQIYVTNIITNDTQALSSL